MIFYAKIIVSVGQGEYFMASTLQLYGSKES